MEKEALNLDSISFVNYINVKMNHEKVLNEDFNIINEVYARLGIEEQSSIIKEIIEKQSLEKILLKSQKNI